MLSLATLCLCALLASSAICVLITSNDGTDIFASSVGNRRNPAIVFVHGFTFSSIVFDDVFKEKRLLDNYYMISYDLRGHGRSGKPNTTEAYSSNSFADDFSAVIKYFNVKSPLFVGWSYGGTVVADIFTYLPPGTISGVFAIAAIPSTDLSTLASTPFALSITTSLLVSDDVAVGINAKNTFVEGCFNNVSNISITTRWSWLGSSVLQLPPISALLLQRSQNSSKLFEAGSKGFPYLTISGTADKVVSNDNITEALRQRHFTNLDVYKVNGGSHALFVDNKNELINILIPFATKVLSG